MVWRRVAEVGTVPPGNCLQADGGSAFILLCNVNGELFAVEDRCTHDGSSLAGGCIEGDEIVCPHHGARFCLRDGAVRAPPAYEDLTTYPVRIHDASIEVDMPA